MSASDWLTDFKSGGVGNTRQLPPGWEQGYDQKSGRIYYFNRQTQQSSWDVPSADMVVPSGQVATRATQQPQRDMQMQRNVAIQRDMTMTRGGDQMLQRSVGRTGHDDRGLQHQQQHQSRGGYGEIGSGAVRNVQRSQMENDSEWHDGLKGGNSAGDQYGRGARGPRSGVRDDKETDYRSGAYGKDSGGYGKGGKGDKGGRNAWGQENRQSERYPRETREEPRERQQRPTGLVSLRGRGFGDDDLPDDRNFQRQCGMAEEINFSENYITGVGLSWLLRPVTTFQYLRVIKLHKNNIGDSAADPLVKLCRNSPDLCEMHLSHNQITWVGADKIVPAACERQILKSVEGREDTLWLRLEQNQIEDARQLFNDWQARGLHVSLYHKTHSGSPPKGVIMPYFMSQRNMGRSSARYEMEDYSWEEPWQWSGGYASEWADASWNGWAADEAWGGWDWHDARSYSSKGKGKGKGSQSYDSKGGDKNNKGSKGAQKGKDARGKGKDSYGEKGDSRKAVDKGLKDEDLEEFCKKEREKDTDGVAQLDLACNHLVGGAGFQFLQDYCAELSKLSIIKLHKNLLTDDVAPFLAEMCSGGCPALQELHLSHNLITRTGAETIVVAACKARTSDGDDGDGETKVLPLWLRLEYNEVEEPQTLVDDWKSRDLCVIPYNKGPSRHNLPPGVHLPYFFSQGKPTGYVHTSEATKEEETTVVEKKPATKADTEKKPTQLKWKPKKKPEREEEASKPVEAEANTETKEGETKTSEDKEPEVETESKENAKDDEKADDGTDKKEKRKGKKGQRRSAEDDADATVFSSGEESVGSAS